MTLALDGVSGCALPTGKGPQYPLDRSLGGPHSWSGHKSCEEKSMFQVHFIKIWSLSSLKSGLMVLFPHLATALKLCHFILSGCISGYHADFE
jgi:hypothetical protein